MVESFLKNFTLYDSQFKHTLVESEKVLKVSYNFRTRLISTKVTDRNIEKNW